MIRYPMVNPSFERNIVSAAGSRALAPWETGFGGRPSGHLLPMGKSRVSLFARPFLAAASCRCTSRRRIEIVHVPSKHKGLWNFHGPALGRGLWMHPARVVGDPTQIVL
jgi:hypothetical protein